jgi:DNA-binding beta-propeller fold protein YncE
MALLAPVLMAAAAPSANPAFTAKYLYNLAETNGIVRQSFNDISYDRTTGELFVVGDNTVRVFNQTGMETYRFQGDERTGGIYAAVALESGDLVVLGWADGELRLSLCDFRGEFQERLSLEGLEKHVTGRFHPVSLTYANGKLYVVDQAAMRAVVVEPDGRVVGSHDLAALAGMKDEEREKLEMRGFSVDRNGAFLFTVPMAFLAYVIEPDGTVRSWGIRGSTPGKFNVISGIDRDEHGNVYVTDMLRSVVTVFDSEFRFVKEIGYRGKGPGGLIVPVQVVAAPDRIFVSQYGNRGVSVFKVAVN